MVSGLLLARNVNVDAVDRHGKTVLERAVIKRHFELIKLLIAHGAQAKKVDISCWIRLLRVGGGIKDYLELLPAHGIDVKPLLLKDVVVKVEHNFRRTELHYAAIRGYSMIISDLLAKNSINTTDSYEKTALDYAIACGHIEVIRILIESGADIQKKDSGGRTYLHLAVAGAHIDVIPLLLEKGLEAHNCDNYGLTPLDIALKNRHTTIAKLLSCRKPVQVSQSVQPSDTLRASPREEFDLDEYITFWRDETDEAHELSDVELEEVNWK